MTKGLLTTKGPPIGQVFCQAITAVRARVAAPPRSARGGGPRARPPRATAAPETRGARIRPGHTPDGASSTAPVTQSRRKRSAESQAAPQPGDAELERLGVTGGRSGSRGARERCVPRVWCSREAQARSLGSARRRRGLVARQSFRLRGAAWAALGRRPEPPPACVVDVVRIELRRAEARPAQLATISAWTARRTCSSWRTASWRCHR